MSSFISFKKDKIKNVFQILGSNYTEEGFIKTFKALYPDDWRQIQDLWLYEEQCKMPGKKQPMPNPDIYMKEMFRNHKPQ